MNPLVELSWRFYYQRWIFIRTNDPAQARFYWRNTFVQIVAIQAHACFQSQTISRAEPNQLNIRVRCDALGDVDGFFGRN